MIALVEPPSASSTRRAFSTDARVMICGPADAVSMRLTAAAPVASAARRRSAWTAGMAAVPGSDMPSASAMQAMVEAVPITAQVPAVVASRHLDIADPLVVDFAGAILRPEAAAIGAGAEPLAVVREVIIGPPIELDGGQVGRDRAHELGRHGLVAAAHQHDRIHRLGADHLLGVHRHEIAEFEAGRIEEDLAERDGGELDRQRARRQHAAFHRVEHLGEMAVAIVEARGV